MIEKRYAALGLFRFDSPVMILIGKIADFIVLNTLWVICCIPVVTIGAATTAKYTIAMRILRDEGSGVIVPYFRAFKDNFKQATVIWCMLIPAIIFCVMDWYYIREKGNDISHYYVAAVFVFSMIVLCICMSVFPFIARFKVTVKEAMKAAFILSFLQFFKFVVIALIEVGTVIAALWYSRWFPLVLLFGTCTAFYFNTLVCVKAFRKIEDKMGDQEDAEEAGEKIFHDASQEKDRIS